MFTTLNINIRMMTWLLKLFLLSFFSDDNLFHRPSLPYFDDADVPGYIHRNDSYRRPDDEEDDEYLRSKFAVHNVNTYRTVISAVVLYLYL